MQDRPCLICVQHWTFERSHDGDMEEAAATGKRVSSSGMSIARLAGGKIADEWAVWDYYGLLQQLGALP